jgi:HD-GYP domain-containing protein (c-di-GMP phosphodiesterase class II)
MRSTVDRGADARAHLVSNAACPSPLHHEKWDGSGYPDGLAGEDIPVAARIFALVDVYDALTSDRPYRSAWPQADVLGYMHEQTGAHFDPQLIPAFMEMVGNQLQ